MTHTHIFTAHVRHTPDGKDIVACKCGHETEVRLVASSPEASLTNRHAPQRDGCTSLMTQPGAAPTVPGPLSENSQ
jgi:hypothetical protein